MKLTAAAYSRRTSDCTETREGRRCERRPIAPKGGFHALLSYHRARWNTQTARCALHDCTRPAVCRGRRAANGRPTPAAVAARAAMSTHTAPEAGEYVYLDTAIDGPNNRNHVQRLDQIDLPI